MSSLIITKAASNELLRQSIYRGTPGKIFLYLQEDNLDVGWMFLRVNVWQESGIPVARTDGLTVYAPDSQKSLLDDLTLDHYQDLTGGGFLISAPKGATKSSCGSGFKFINSSCNFNRVQVISFKFIPKFSYQRSRSLLHVASLLQMI